MFALIFVSAMMSQTSTVPAVITLPTVTITAKPPSGHLVNCGAWRPLESGSGMVRTCEVTK